MAKAGEILICEFCGKAVIANHYTQKYCRDCSDAINGQRAKARRKNPNYTPIMTCEVCGKETTRKSTSQRVCPECAPAWHAKKKTEYWHNVAKHREKKPEKEEEQPIPEEKNRPFTLSEVAAAARKHNMSYGKYVAAWKSGAVEPPERIPPKKKKRGRPCKGT